MPHFTAALALLGAACSDPSTASAPSSTSPSAGATAGGSSGASGSAGSSTTTAGEPSQGGVSSAGSAGAPVTAGNAGATNAAGQGGSAGEPSLPEPGFGGCTRGVQLHGDDFTVGLAQWTDELEDAAQSAVTASNGQLVIDAAAGATVWFEPLLEGDLVIDYRVTVVLQDGPHDRLTDLNSFWMATDPKDANLFTRSGKFAEYNALHLYYVGFGGNTNTTTRFRRYDGDTTRPDPLTEYTDAAHLLVANREYHIQHVVCGKHIAYIVDGTPYFEYDDASPYRSGRFAFRTVGSHQAISDFSVSRLAAP